ncbi:MAG TPA: glycosyltransferase family 87 protein [Tepidisphaeraceae bacterium]
MTLPHLLRPCSQRKRLWQLSVLMALVFATFVGGNFYVAPDKAVNWRMMGLDFLPFYTAGTFAREGRTADLYELPIVADSERRIAQAEGLEIDIDFAAQNFGPWWNPPFYAWAFAPLSMLSFHHALLVWTGLNLVALAAAIWMLIRLLPGRNDGKIDWRSAALVPLLVITSMPLIQAISHGQNTCISLALLCAIVTFWRNNQAWRAGACCALLAYKPQLAAVVACVLVASQGWKAMAGLSFVGSILLLATQLLMPGALIDYLHRLPANVYYMQVAHDYLWERHATLKAFWRLLIQGRSAGELHLTAQIAFLTSTFIVGGLLVRSVWSHVRGGGWSTLSERVWRDRLIAATITAAPLLMPFYFDYDLLLLAIPAVLLAGEQLASDQVTRASRWLSRAWMALYASMLINLHVTNVTGLSMNVLLLLSVAVLMIVRARRTAGVSPAGRIDADAFTITSRAA